MKIVELKPSNNVSKTLRTIADQLDSGQIDHGETGATLIIGSEVFHMGTHDDGDATVNAVFNMNIGLAKLTTAVLGFDPD